MSTGTPVAAGEKITAAKMNLKVETAAENPQNVTTSRVVDVVYQNPDPIRSLLVCVSFEIEQFGAAMLRLYLKSKNTSPPDIIIGQVGLYDASELGSSVGVMIVGVVKANFYYAIYKGGVGNVTKIAWIETLV